MTIEFRDGQHIAGQSAEKPTRIKVDLIEDGRTVAAEFRWNCARYARPVGVTRSDGFAYLSLSAADARELHRKLEAALEAAKP